MKNFSACAFAVALWALLSAPAAAETARAATAADNGAWSVVQSLTQDIVGGAKNVAKDGEQAFFQQVERKLRKAIDFEGFARGVMGEYASESRRAALSRKQRKQLDRQIQTFSDVFRNRLVQAYGNAFLSVADVIRVETLKPRKPANGNTEVVVQKLHGLSENPFTIYYQMKRRDGAWRLHNIAIEKINLGKLYRTQFESAAEQYKGDLDQVIANWSGVQETPAAAPAAPAPAAAKNE